MKKTVYIALLLTITLFLAACSKEPEAENEVTTEVNTLEGVSMELAEYTSHEALVRIVNNRDAAYISDRLFSVQVEREGKWYALENKSSGSAPADLLVHPGKETSEFMCTWVRMYGALPEGHYRLVKWLYPYGLGFRGEGTCLAAEFYIGPEQQEGQQWIRDEAPYLTVTYEGQSIVPYFHEVKRTSYGQYWTDKLTELEQEIPIVYWSDDFRFEFNRDSSTDSIHIFDENCERIYFGDEFFLDFLEPGRYYIDVRLIVQEGYNTETERYQTSEWSAVFVLVIE